MDWRMNGPLDSSPDAMQGLSSSGLSSPPGTENRSFAYDNTIHSTSTANLNEQLAATRRGTATWPETAAPGLHRDASRNHPRRHDADAPGTGPRLTLAQCQDSLTTSPLSRPHQLIANKPIAMTRQARSQTGAGGLIPSDQTTTGEDTSPTSTKSSASRRTQPDAPLPANSPTSPGPAGTAPWRDHSPPQTDTETTTQQARKSQNRVGKRYRDKLGAQFENLQAELHLDDDDDDGAGAGAGRDGLSGQGQLEPPAGGQGKARKRRRPVNKTKVMDLARERISSLMEEWEAVNAEAEALQEQRVLEGW